MLYLHIDELYLMMIFLICSRGQLECSFYQVLKRPLLPIFLHLRTIIFVYSHLNWIHS
ncbi:hypothetical protein BD408DRAFT_411442 [Parasitella parasitica]|nr:hypothetical protein BD408DRAFT_411442 [Parasitella parasitica]